MLASDSPVVGRAFFVWIASVGLKVFGSLVFQV
jgi:hypothetical protein